MTPDDSGLCSESFTYFEGWCYSIQNSSDYFEANCEKFNATMSNEPNYKDNYFISGIIENNKS